MKYLTAVATFIAGVFAILFQREKIKRQQEQLDQMQAINDSQEEILKVSHVLAQEEAAKDEDSKNTIATPDDFRNRGSL